MRRKCTFSKNMEKTFCLPYWVQMLGLNYFTMQTFFHILAVVISIFIPLVSIILWESKTHALRSLDSSSSNVNKKKKCIGKPMALVAKITEMLWERIMGTWRLDGKEVQRCALVSMLFICEPLGWMNSCLLQTATRNAIFFFPDGGCLLIQGLQVCCTGGKWGNLEFAAFMEIDTCCLEVWV